MGIHQKDKDISETKQALFELMDADIKSNVGRIPVPDYLEMKAGEYGYDSYEEMYEEGYRIAGYEKISPKVIEEWHNQKAEERPSLKKRLAREQEKSPLYSDNRKRVQAERGMQEF